MILDDRTYGIQAFDTPEEAFGLMASSWSSRSEEDMVILNDREFLNGQSVSMSHFGNNFAIKVTQLIYAGGADKGFMVIV